MAKTAASAVLAVDRPTEWLSPTQLAAELDLPVQTVYRWRSERRGPRGRTVGRHVRFSREDVNAWLDSLIDDAPSGS